MGTVTSTTSCNILLLWKPEVLVEYNFLFSKWIFIELLSSYNCGGGGESVSYDEHQPLQPRNGVSVKIEAQGNQFMSYCG